MPDSEAPLSARRSFLGRLATATAAFGVSAWPISAKSAAFGSAPASSADEPWVGRLRGTDRVIFHAHEPTGGLALRWAQTYLDTQKTSYGRKDGDCGVIVGLNGKSIGLVFNDVMWAKHPIAQTLSMSGASNPAGPAGTNTIAQLLGRGVIILVCQNSLRASGQRFLPESQRNDPAARTAFANEAAANLAPGIEVVPAMVVTLQMAQDRGCRYVYAGG